MMEVLQIEVQVAGSDVVSIRLRTEPPSRGPIEWTVTAETKADHIASALLGKCEVRRDGGIRLYRRPGTDGWRPVVGSARG